MYRTAFSKRLQNWTVVDSDGRVQGIYRDAATALRDANESNRLVEKMRAKLRAALSPTTR